MTSPPPRAVPAAPPPERFPGRVLSDRIVSGLRRRARERLDVARSAADSRWGRPRDTHQPIYLVAPAGHPNYGDEQLLAGWLRYLRHRLPGTPVVVDCHTPGQAAVLHHSAHPDVLFTDTLWRLAAEYPDAAGAIGFTRRAVRDLGVRPAVASGVDLLRSASVVHLIGGGYVNDLWPHHLGVAAAAAEVGRLTGARVVATGQGLVPCADAGRLADAFSGFDLVAVRDEASLDLLAATGVPVRWVGDDGWLALAGPESPVYSADPDTCRDLVLCLQADLVDAGELAGTVARALVDWGVPGEQISVIEAIPGGDRIVWDMIVDRARSAGDGSPLAALRLDRARFVPFQQVWADGFPARPGQTWLTTRFHAHLFAAARGASGVALCSGSEYYDVKHGSLVAAGSPWALIDVDGRVGAELPSSGGFSPDGVARRASAAEDLAGEVYPIG